jgi:hypothetical protein
LDGEVHIRKIRLALLALLLSRFTSEVSSCNTPTVYRRIVFAVALVSSMFVFFLLSTFVFGSMLILTIFVFGSTLLLPFVVGSMLLLPTVVVVVVVVVVVGTLPIFSFSTDFCCWESAQLFLVTVLIVRSRLSHLTIGFGCSGYALFLLPTALVGDTLIFFFPTALVVDMLIFFLPTVLVISDMLIFSWQRFWLLATCSPVLSSDFGCQRRAHLFLTNGFGYLQLAVHLFRNDVGSLSAKISLEE